MSDILWSPSSERILASNLVSFAKFIESEQGLAFGDYPSLWDWSVSEAETFWDCFWDYGQIIGEKGSIVVDDITKMPGASWFPEARINFAENMLRPDIAPSDDALVFWGEDKVKRSLSRAALHDRVACCRVALQNAGVVQGDRVAGYMPNMPETIIAMLATASLGAVWSSASPDFGVQGVVDRFGQIEPKVLFCVDAYHYNGKIHDCREKIAAVVGKIPSVDAVVMVSYAGDGTVGPVASARTWDGFLAEGGLENGSAPPLVFDRVPFGHPLYVMFSSGTTGVPKCIVHGHGGTLLQQLKEHILHSDAKPGDRVFYFTTCGWMMWNWLVAALGARCTVMLYDGAPSYPSGAILFDYVDAESINFFGTSAKWIDAIRKAGLVPKDTHKLDSMKAIASTGSPLVPEAFDYVYDSIKEDVQLASISGGTDIVSCFMLGSPWDPVRRGEIQRRGLGMAVQVFNEDGKPVKGEKGELVCTKAFPCMPVGFWNDPDGAKFKAAYFERFPGIWTHGDWIALTDHGGIVVYGRSDATLNPGGVRIGTAEIYRQVESLQEIREAIVVGQEWDGDVRVILFVVLSDEAVLTEELIATIKAKIRSGCTPRHVPAKILAVPDIPRTKSNKIVELAVREVIHGRPVKNTASLANPDALDAFAGLAELQS